MPDAPRNVIAGRSAFLAVMREEGVRRMFGNPGTTELPIMHALTEQTEISYVLGLQESVVIAMADGYARASGELVACNVHVAPGLGNAMGTLYTANVTGTPMIVTAGQQEQGHGLTEPLLYAPLVPIAQPVVKWAVEVNRIEDLPRIMHRAAKVAQTAPTGPVFISLPGDILNAEAAIDLGDATKVDTAVRPSDAAIEALARRILAAKAPAILAGTEIYTSHAWDEAIALADALGAPVWQQSVQSGAHFPSEHPCYMGNLNRNQAQVRDTLMPHDLLISLGAEVLTMSVYSPVDPLPPDTKLVQIGLRDWEMGKNWAAEIALRADLKLTLQALLPVLKRLGGEKLAQRAAATQAGLAQRNWSAQRAKKAKAAMALAQKSPLAPEWLMWRLSEALPKDAVIVEEALTTAFSLFSFYRYRDRHSFYGNVTGGIGWGIAAAVGIQLALPQRRVLALIGDGSAMYSIQALWSAAHYKAPVIFLLCNNGGYRIIKQRLKSFHGNDRFIGMDLQDPAIDLSALARSMGVPATRVSTAAEFDAALAAAVKKTDGPCVIEAMVEKTV